MAVVTAQLLIGTPHPHHTGLTPTHALTLWENSRPTWVLGPFTGSARDEPAPALAVWHPTVRHMLEDGLVMAAVYGLRHESIVERARHHLGDLSRRPILLPEVPDEALTELREQARGINYHYAVLVSAIDESTIRHQLTCLEHWPMDLYVCMPVYQRVLNGWRGGTTQVRGTLDAPPLPLSTEGR